MLPPPRVCTHARNSDDSSEVWLSEKAANDGATEPAGSACGDTWTRSGQCAGKSAGLKLVVQERGCCRERDGSRGPWGLRVKVNLKAGKSYYVKAMVKEGGGGEYLRVGMQIDPKEWGYLRQGWTGRRCKGLPLNIFNNQPKDESGKRINLKCGSDAYACRYHWCGIRGVQVRDLTRQTKFKNFDPNRMKKLGKNERFAVESGTGSRDPSYNRRGGCNNNLGSMIEGFIKAPETDDYTFSAYGSAASRNRALFCIVASTRRSLSSRCRCLARSLAPPGA